MSFFGLFLVAHRVFQILFSVKKSGTWVLNCHPKVLLESVNNQLMIKTHKVKLSLNLIYSFYGIIYSKAMGIPHYKTGDFPINLVS